MNGAQMLTIANVSSGAQAATYYEQADDYYSQDRSPSQWSGKAAAGLGLSGSVDAKTFRAILDGYLPDGSNIHHGGEGSARRGGTDLTFSAPKSVSIQALIGGDLRLLQAHEAAVARALMHAETQAACRVTSAGATSRQMTGNMVIAQFRHDLSRAADPQLHTHAVVLNATQRGDGQWRAIDNEPLYRHKMWLGAFYRCELAMEVQALGYEVRVTHSDGRFELSHIDPVQIKAFSNRSTQIENALLARGLTREQATARQLQVATIQTREAKTQCDRTELMAQWKQRAKEAGINLQTPAPDTFNLRRDGDGSLRSEATAAEQAVTYACKHLMEREAVVRRVDIERVALERGTGKTDLVSIRRAIESAAGSGELIRGNEQYTTPAAQQREREILGMELAGRDAVDAVLDAQTVKLKVAATSLNEGQRSVVLSVLTGRNRITGVQGSAGTGKTTALRNVRELAEAERFKLVGVAPSAGAARELAGSGIESQTLAAFATHNYAGLNTKTLVVLDEAGMVSAGDMHGLLSAVTRAQARIVLVGDTQQLKAIQAGKPFAQLQHAGMSSALLTEIQRQKSPCLKGAVELAAAGRAVESAAQLKLHVVEIALHTDRQRAIALDYAQMTLAERKGTLLVAGTNQSREAVNTEVRQALGLAGHGKTVLTLRSKNLTNAEALRTVSYQPGDVVRAERDYKSLGLSRGDLATVLDGPAGVVMLERTGGARLQWRPVNHRHFTVYTQSKQEFAVGDLVRFTQNDYTNGVFNGDRATVQAFDAHAGCMYVENADGARLPLPIDRPLHIEHGYCQTVHAAQGKTCERILIDLPASSATSNESSYYVAISRASRDATIYTDDRELLPDALRREDGKTAALEVDDPTAAREPHTLGGASLEMG